MTTPRPSLATLAPLAAIITVAFMGSVIVTPLYVLYQRKFGFSEIVLTLVYAVYAIGNVAALLIFGQVSDQLGRKRVALPALGLAAASALVFLFAAGTAWLFLGRLLIGLAVGILSGTGTAWLAERFGPDRRLTATVAAATANLSGIALGPLIAGLLAQYVAHPLQVPLLVYLGVLVLVGCALARVDDSHERRGVPLRAVRVHPRVGVPPELLRAFAAPAVTAFVSFGLGGLYFALIPSILHDDLHVTNVAVGGLMVFEFGAIAAGTIVVARRVPPRLAMTVGLVGLLPAVALIVVAQGAHSLPVLIVATAIAAVTTSLCYRGSLESVNAVAPDDRRAEMVSTYFIACFVGNAVPVIGIGVMTSVSDSFVATVVFAGVVAVLALAALAWDRAQRGR